MSEMETLRKLIDESNNIVFFGGAGVSTESNIPDFRSTDGLYNQKYDYPPEQILSHTFFMKKRIGQTVKVLVESVTRDNSEELLGKTAQDEKVSFKANKSLIGKFIYVTITELNGHTFKGCVCEAN